MHQNYTWDEVHCENSTREFTSTLENTTGHKPSMDQNLTVLHHRQTDEANTRLTQQRITPLAIFKYRLQRATLTYKIFLQNPIPILK
jgi:hypothetical protein